MEPVTAPTSLLSLYIELASTVNQGLEEIQDIYDEAKHDILTQFVGRSRTAKRVEDAKKRARPELNRYGWDTLGFAHIFDVPVLSDNIQRVDATNMSVEEFRKRFEYPSVPCIMTGLTDTWRANDKWTIERLYRKYRNQKFKCGEDDDGYSVKLKMKYYVEYMKGNEDDSPLYIFDSGFGCRHKTKRLLEDYEIPVMFRDDLFNYSDFKKRPPHRWFVMGPARSGTGIHIDPLGTSAWNSLVKGHKRYFIYNFIAFSRWVLISPNAPKHLVKPTVDEKGKHPQEAVTWFNTVYRRVTDPLWPKEYRVIEARQGPGETMFVPSGWWHVVINEDDTIAVTQNYCSIVNLPQVWPKTVSGRPKLSKHWYKRLSTERPELIPIIQQSMSRPPDPNDSSSDSSSSSSSSDSDSSSNDEEMPKRGRYEKYDDPQGDSDCISKMHSTPPI